MFLFLWIGCSSQLNLTGKAFRGQVKDYQITIFFTEFKTIKEQAKDKTSGFINTPKEVAYTMEGNIIHWGWDDDPRSVEYKNGQIVGTSKGFKVDKSPRNTEYALTLIEGEPNWEKPTAEH